MRHKYKEGEERGQSFLLLVLEFELFSNAESRIAYLLPEDSSCKGYSCGGMIVFIIVRVSRIALDETNESKIPDNH